MSDRVRGLVLSALLVGSACGTGPAAEPPPSRTATPELREAPPPPFECPPIEVAQQALREDAEAVRSLFTALGRGEDATPWLASDSWHSTFLETAARARACPRRYGEATQWHAFMELDGTLGTLPVVVRRDSSTRPHVVSLVVTEEAIRARLAAGELRSWLDAHPGWSIVHQGRGQFALFVLTLGPSESVLCGTREPDEGDAPVSALPIRFCVHADRRLARVGVGEHVDPPLADPDDDETSRTYRDFVDLDHATYEITPSGLVPARPVLRRTERWSYLVDGSSGTRDSPTLTAFDPSAIPLDAIDLLRPRPQADHCIRGESLFCCVAAERWRCVDPGVAASRSFDAEAGSLDIRDAFVSLVTDDCDGGSESTSCVRTLRVLDVDGDALVERGSIDVGRSDGEHFREREVGGTSSVGGTESTGWHAEVVASDCLHFTEAEHVHERFRLFLGAHAQGWTGPREVEDAGVSYGSLVTTLPRFAPERSPLAAPPSGPVPDLRGWFALRGEQWERVESCGSR